MRNWEFWGGISQFPKTFKIPVQLDVLLGRRMCINQRVNRGMYRRSRNPGTNARSTLVPGAETSVELHTIDTAGSIPTLTGWGETTLVLLETMDMIDGVLGIIQICLLDIILLIPTMVSLSWHFILGTTFIRTKNKFHQNPATGQWVNVWCLQFRGAGRSPGWGYSSSS